MTSALFLGQNVNLAVELGVRMNGAGFGNNLAALDLVSLYAAEKSTDVIAGHQPSQGTYGTFRDRYTTVFLFSSVRPTISTSSPILSGAALNSTGSNGATAGDGEYVLNRHQEGLIGFTIGSGDVTRQQPPSAQ